MTFLRLWVLIPSTSEINLLVHSMDLDIIWQKFQIDHLYGLSLKII